MNCFATTYIILSPMVLRSTDAYIINLTYHKYKNGWHSDSISSLDRMLWIVVYATSTLLDNSKFITSNTKSIVVLYFRRKKTPLVAKY